LAIVTATNNSPTALLQELGAYATASEQRIDTLFSRLVASLQPILNDTADGTPISVSDAHITVQTYSPTGILDLYGSGLTGGSATVTEFIYSSYDYPGFNLRLGGVLHVDSAGNAKGSFSTMVLSDGGGILRLAGQMPVDNGVTQYTSMSYALNNPDGSISELTYTGRFVEDAAENISGTLTSLSFTIDPDGLGFASPVTRLNIPGLSVAFNQSSDDLFDFDATNADVVFSRFLSGDDQINGSQQDDTLYGYDGNDRFDAGPGADTMAGGRGNDVYLIDNAGDRIIERADEGTDLARVAIATAGGSYALSAHIENATLINAVAFSLTGNGRDNKITGNAFANTLSGGAGADILNGGASADTLIGGEGDDVYVVDNAGDVVTEILNQGTDLVQVAIATAGGTYLLTDHVEKAILTNAVAFNLTGNALANVLTGNALANTLDGDGDTDTLIGGAGNDLYVVDLTAGGALEDSVVETVGNGTDTLRLRGTSSQPTSVVLTLDAALENLDASATGSSLLDLTGNGVANLLKGNAAANILSGGAGADTMVGGDGDDVYVVDNAGDAVTEAVGEGNDRVAATVSYTLGADVEQLSLIGSAAINGTGNALDNRITGSLGANLIDGGAGADTMIGRAGDDTYVVDNAGDVVTETLNQGTDLVQVAIASAGGTYALGDHVERATLTSAVAFSLTGNALANVLTGNALANTLDGGISADTMIGGAGDDIYVVDDAGDVITESLNQGTDLVQVAIASAGGTYALTDHVENATLTNAVAFNLTGNALANVLTGNALANILSGGAGADTMVGGDGDDVYVVDNAGDAVTEAVGEGNDRVAATVSYTLGADVEQLSLIGSAAINGTGNALDNRITGSLGANLIDGGAGADTMIGRAGDDTYVVDNAGDVVTETLNQGTDLVQVAIASAGGTYALGDHVERATLTNAVAFNLTGNALANVLTGNALANTLDGGIGADTMIGGAGDDTYVVDDAGDVITETLNQGTDLVQVAIASAGGTYALTDHVENGTLTNAVAFNLTGNGLVNVLTGNALANILNGGAGDDTMVGGDGDDVYVVDNAGDAVTEAVGEGNDRVASSISYTLGANVEQLSLIGSAAINGTGNALDNRITGSLGANLIDGGAGADTMIGRSGDDTYVVDDAGDVVAETLNQGTDLVQVAIASAGGTYALTDHVEYARLTNAVAFNLTGNGLDNRLWGNALDNTLRGGDGNDAISAGAGADTLSGGSGLNTLNGGAGADVFYFDALAGAGTLQTLSDFNVAEDRIVLKADVFAAISGSFSNVETPLDASMFQTGNTGTALDGAVRMIYNSTSGNLYYDADGNAAGAAVLVAHLDGTVALTAAHIGVVTG
jgi:Ca2+-binding RTX toxin-like protein